MHIYVGSEETKKSNNYVACLCDYTLSGEAFATLTSLYALSLRQHIFHSLYEFCKKKIMIKTHNRLLFYYIQRIVQMVKPSTFVLIS